MEYTSENEDRIASTAQATFTGREVRDTWKILGPNGNRTVTFADDEAPAFLRGARSATLDRSALPPGEIRELFALGLEQPMSRQISGGVQRQIGARAALSLDAVWVAARTLPKHRPARH